MKIDMKNALLYLFLLALLLIGVRGAKAQTFFEGTGGQTSITLPIGGIARINTTASSLKIGYYYNRSDRDVVFGVDASGISNNGFAPLVTNKELSPEANINVNIGIKNITTGETDLSGFDYVNFRIGVGRSRYRLIDTAAPFERQISTKYFTKVKIGLSYNYYLNGNMIFGGFAGYDRTNNIPDLNRLTIKESTSVGNANGTDRTVEAKYTAWQGELEAVNQFSLYFDYVYIPEALSNRIALSAYSRSRFNQIQNVTNAGVGVYLNREGKPLQLVGGLIYEFADVFNASHANSPLGERGTLGIVVGYNF